MLDHRHEPIRKYPYVFRISGSVLPQIWAQIVSIGIFATGVVAISELTRYSLEINPVLISTLGFIVSLSLSFRTQSSYARWWEARIAWDRLTSNARNLSRVIWISGPERTGQYAARDILLKKSAINLIGIFAVSLKNHLRNQRGHTAPDLIHLIPHLDTYSRRPKDGKREEAELRSTWFLHNEDETLGDDWCQATLSAGVLPTEITYHLQSYMEYVRSANPSLQNYYAQNMTILLHEMNQLTSNCERIQSTIFPVAYNIVISQILWIFVIGLPFQLCSVLSWATIPLCMVTSSFLFSLYYIGSEIEDPFGFDSNDLDVSNPSFEPQLTSPAGTILQADSP
ncbi:Bestrophin/UPF0187 [Protomyces lactucae-debilis]|uniref:Bestrophin/UPF0187 n=1 Tax=Protomyces lactucae-debilis TaxID=2754530 RepID=A0A1Y2FRE9_PROLT|nr:Bestrophin/UPF0187 [Protomyces lactucae-debilis]ORY86157.1 Bestrophin/UPF0187 [Protomyces lactucae-debilis]